MIAAGLGATPDRQQPHVPATVARVLVDEQYTYFIYYYTDNAARTLDHNTTVLDQDGRNYDDYPNGDYPDDDVDVCNKVTSDHPILQFYQAPPSRQVNCLDTLQPVPPTTRVVVRIQLGVWSPTDSFRPLTTEVIRIPVDLRGLPAYGHRHPQSL